jgi:hypothetical protein
MATDTARDILLDANHDLAVSGQDLQLVAGKDAIRQALDIRLKFFRGEWFLDLNIGMPWLQQVLIKGPSPSLLTAVFRKEILGTPGVKSLSSLDLQFDRATRMLSGSFSCDTDAGLLKSVEI